jgi:hypothetical protein
MKEKIILGYFKEIKVENWEELTYMEKISNVGLKVTEMPKKNLKNIQ